eukprot:Sspe_Gene.118742::Locus_112990_Transcript_1_2_Confidence_0.667_Length_699::g.118742::m.118742/K00788/thiE; thiamine-phosphate pyrophosphorylase
MLHRLFHRRTLHLVVRSAEVDSLGVDVLQSPLLDVVHLRDPLSPSPLLVRSLARTLAIPVVPHLRSVEAVERWMEDGGGDSHLPFHVVSALPPGLRSRWGHGASLKGVSVHSLAEASCALSAGADYLLVGTMYPTPSHPEKLSVEGPSLMADIRGEHPEGWLVGIGGIDPSRVGTVVNAGAHGIAVSSRFVPCLPSLRTALDTGGDGGPMSTG